MGILNRYWPRSIDVSKRYSKVKDI